MSQHESPAVAPSLLDRAAWARTDEAALERLWEDPGARRLAVHDGAVALPAAALAPGAADPLASQPLADSTQAPLMRRVFLGIDAAQRPWWLVRLAERPPLPGDVVWTGLRELGPRLDQLSIEAMSTAVALEGWHARHRFCPQCGHPTDPLLGGWVRSCSADGSEHYPRTDPAIIVLVIDDMDRALLARQVRWPAGWMSTLAGFVEPGERAESAVRREVAEEVGVTVAAATYLTSQPWPFPGSLMLGFHAVAATTDLRPDGEEIAEAEWFTRESLAAAAAEGRVRLPPAISIARWLIERWYGQKLPGSWLRG